MCDWPEGVSVRHSSFRLTPPVPLQSLVPEMDPQAKDLMEVSDFYLAGDSQNLGEEVLGTLTY